MTRHRHDPARFAAIAALVLLAPIAASATALAALRPDLWQRALARVWSGLTEYDATALGTYLLLLAAVLAAEAVALGWRNSSLARLIRPSRSARADMVIAVIQTLEWSTLIMFALSGGVLWALTRWVNSVFGLQILAGLDPWLQFVIAFVVVDFVNYWYHRVSHEIEFLWQAHKYHHAATEFTILTGSRVHALEEGFRHVLIVVPLALLGTPVEAYFGVGVVLTLIDMLQHSMVPWTYGWVGRWLVYSPVGHRIHHSALREHWDCNYGNFLVIWDRLFGTWYGGSRVNDEVNVTENPYNQRGVIPEYLACVYWFFEALVKSLRSGEWRPAHRIPAAQASTP